MRRPWPALGRSATENKTNNIYIYIYTTFQIEVPLVRNEAVNRGTDLGFRHVYCRGQLKCDGTRAETRCRLSAKRTSPFKSAGGRQFSRLLAAELCASAVVRLDTPCSEVVWRVVTTHCIRQFPLHFSSRRPSHFIWTLQRNSTIIRSQKVFPWIEIHTSCLQLLYLPLSPLLFLISPPPSSGHSVQTEAANDRLNQRQALWVSSC